MTLPNNEYWTKRVSESNQNVLNNVINYDKLIQKEYKKTQRRIKDDIEKWMNRLAVNNGISLPNARKLLKKGELAEFKWSVQEYIKRGKENAFNKQWVKELENASAKVHIDYLTAMQTQVKAELELLAQKQTATTTKALTNCYQDTMYTTLYNTSQQLGVARVFGTLSKEQVAKSIRLSWSTNGGDYSSKIWDNKNKLNTQLTSQLTQMIARGEAPDRAIKELSKTMDVSMNSASRIIQTEASAVASQAKQDCYKEFGCDEFQVVATFDKATCATCGAMDGQHMSVKDYAVGTTAPPFHPWCRCTTRPYFEDLQKAGERFARDSDGKTHIVPTDMSFKEFSEKYLGKAVPEAQVPTPEAPKPKAEEVKPKTPKPNLKEIPKITDDELTNYNMLESIDNYGIEKLEYNRLEKPITHEEIVTKLGGGDKTKGSCVSLAFAYAGNKNGLDVLDFRGGRSQEFFSRSFHCKAVADIEGVKAVVEEQFNDFIACKNLFKNVEEGKEYILMTGKHASVIKKLGDELYYLELQSATRNGYTKFEAGTLRKRFGCQRSHVILRRKCKEKNVLVDIESLKDNKVFNKALDYINTKAESQLKGVTGSVK